MRIVRLVGSVLVASYIVGLSAYLVLRVAFGDSMWWLAFANNFAPYYFLPLLALLPLALILRLNQRLPLLMLILLVVGEAWFAPRFFPRSLALASGDTLKVITFNVWGNNQRLAEVDAWLHEQDADIVLFQEIPPAWSGVGVETLKDLYPYQVSQTEAVRSWGQATLSKYSILSTEDFDLEGDGTGSHQRLIVDVDGEQVAVYNIHTYMPTRENPRFYLPISHFSVGLALAYDDNARNHQIRNLLARLESEPLPYIVGGDFNMSDNAVIYDSVAARMRDSFREGATGLGGTWPVGERVNLPNWIPPLIRIDYVWHSEAFRSTSAATGPRLGSDHLPVIVELERRRSS